MSAISRYLDTNRRREIDGVTLPPDFVERVLGGRKTGPVAIANARQAAELVEQDRQDMDYKARAERLLALLTRCLPHVMEARQGRGDIELEALIRAEVRRG